MLRLRPTSPLPRHALGPAALHLSAGHTDLATRLFPLPLRPGWGSGTPAGKQHGGGPEVLSLPPVPPASTPDSTAGLKLRWEVNRCPRGLNHQHTLGHTTFYPWEVGGPGSSQAQEMQRRTQVCLLPGPPCPHTSSSGILRAQPSAWTLASPPWHGQ